MNPPPAPLPKAKRPTPSQSEEHVAKKPRVEDKGEPIPPTGDTSVKSRTTAKVLPSQPANQAPGPATATSKKSAKPSYGGAHPSTNLQILSLGASTHHRTTPGEPTKSPIKLSFRERPRPEPPRADVPNDDRLYSVPPQPQSFVYKPPSKTAHTTSHRHGNSMSQASALKYPAPLAADHDDLRQHKPARPSVTTDSRADAPPHVLHKRAPALVEGHGATQDQLDDPPGTFSSHINMHNSLISFV